MAFKGEFLLVYRKGISKIAEAYGSVFAALGRAIVLLGESELADFEIRDHDGDLILDDAAVKAAARDMRLPDGFDATRRR